LVEGLFEGTAYLTDVWAATDRVVRPIRKLAKKKGAQVLRFMKLLQRCAEHGFERMPAGVVRHEGKAVYAIGDRYGPLLRASGFYVEGQKKRTFVIMDFYEKHGQKARTTEQERNAEIARIREQGEWTKV